MDLDQVASLTEGFSGAELEHCILEGLFLAFHEKRDIKTEDLIKVARETVPLSRVNAESVKALRTWASTRARAAEITDSTTKVMAQHIEVKGPTKT